MSFVQCDDMVQNLSATASNPAFRGSILPGRLDARPLRFQTGRLQKCDDGGIEYRIDLNSGPLAPETLRPKLARATTKSSTFYYIIVLC